MPRICLFDLLPVELLHILFNCFLAHEVLISFSNVSDYVDAVLLSYCEYRLNLRAIDSTQLSLVCRRIQPEQIHTLTLSRGIDGSRLSVQMLSLFPLERFVQLRSLKLINIEYQLIEPIFNNLQKLPNLHSLSFDVETINYKYDTLNVDFPRKLNTLKSFLSRIFSQILPQMYYLYLNDGDVLESISLHNLHHLKLKKCSLHQLETIIQNAPELRSLDVSLRIDKPFSQAILSSSRLNEFNLTIENYSVSMNQLERLLLNLPSLKHLGIYTSSRNLADGQRWQRLTKNLITFNFKFTKTLDLNKLVLNTFCTPYWLEEKCWFVAYQNNCLFSVPRVPPNHAIMSSYTRIYSTAPDIRYVNESVTKLTVDGIPIDNNIFYAHIEELDLRSSISYEELRDIIDFQYVKHIYLLSLVDLVKFMPFERSLPRTYKLTILNELTIDMVKQMRSYRLEQIRKLDIVLSYEHKDSIIKVVANIFPFIEEISYRNYIHSIGDVFRLVSEFAHLHSAYFYTYFIYHNIERNIYLNSDYPLDASWKYLADKHFLCHVRSTSNNQSISRSIKIPMLQSSENVHRFQQIELLYYKLFYYLFRNPQPLSGIISNPTICSQIFQYILYVTVFVFSYFILYIIIMNSFSKYMNYILILSIWLFSRKIIGKFVSSYNIS